MQRRSMIGAMALLSAKASWATKRGRSSFDVAIIGGGLAGLNAARICLAAGKSVLLLEARERCGGRLQTQDSSIGPIELGAVEVGENYSRFSALAKAYQVELVTPKAVRIPGLCMHFDGRNFADSDWLTQPQVAEANPAFREQPPSAWLAFWLAQQKHLLAAGDWSKPDALRFDISLREYLKAHASATDFELRLAEIASNFSDFSTTSALDVLRRDVMRKAAGPMVKTLAVAGGSQALPIAMAQALANTVDLRHGLRGQLKSLIKNRRGFELKTQSGDIAFAQKIIVALPANVFTSFASSVFSTTELQTVQPLWQRPMTPVTTLHFAPKSAYWEQDGLSPNMWIDGPLERVFAVADSAGRVQRVLVWINGRAALALDNLNAQERRTFVELELARVRPSSQHQLSFLTEKSWSADPLAGGAYAEIAAGHCANVQRAAAQVKTLKNIAFAGEHTVFDLPGMEAALASGERAAEQVLA